MSVNSSTSFLRRLKLAFSIIGALILLGGLAKTLQSEVVTTRPDPPRIQRFVNTDLSIAMVRAEDGIADLNRRLDVLEKANLKDQISIVQQRVDSMYLLVKYVAGAILSLCAKDIFTALINFLKAKTPPTS